MTCPIVSLQRRLLSRQEPLCLIYPGEERSSLGLLYSVHERMQNRSRKMGAPTKKMKRRMPLAKNRDPRLVTVPRGGTLERRVEEETVGGRLAGDNP